MNSNSSPAIPRWVLVALTLAVLLVHGWLLKAAPRALGADGAAGVDAPKSFVTRTIMALPANRPPSEAPPAQVAPEPTKVAKTSPVRAPRALPQTTARTMASVPTNDIAPNEEPEPAAEIEPLAAADSSTPNNAAAVAEPPSTETPAAAAAPQAQPTPPSPTEDASPMAPDTKLPAPMRLRYNVQANKFPFSLNAELLWQHDGTDYNAHLIFSAFGQSRVQTSRGKVDQQGLAPIRFSDKYRAELAAHFNRETGKITFSANTPDVPLMAGAQDRLSVLVQLGALLAQDPGAYPQATTIFLQTAGPRDASVWLFTVQAHENLVLPGGEQATVKLVRLPRRDYDQTVELWLAPALNYLPARIRITEHNGDYVDQQWLATEPPS